MEGKKSYRIAKRPLYREEIKEALMEAIVSGELAPGGAHCRNTMGQGIRGLTVSNPRSHPGAGNDRPC